jgi:hypothetical protein
VTKIAGHRSHRLPHPHTIDPQENRNLSLLK